jgi:heme exporter protein D
MTHYIAIAWSFPAITAAILLISVVTPVRRRKKS